MIPKIIHQIWYQGINEIPKDLQNNSKKIINIHQKWKYIIWDDNLVKSYFKNNRKVLNTYNKLEYMHQKIDFIRYCILYEFGGVYMDMDVTILKPFDKLVETYGNYECILSNINLNTIDSYALCLHKECLNNGIMICQPKSRFILSLVDEIHKNNECVSYDLNNSMCINRTTGPLLITRIYNEYKEKIDKSNIKILNWSYLEPCILGDLCDVKKNTIVIHHHNTTWINKIFTTIMYYYLKWKVIIYILLIIILIQVLYYVICYIKQ